MFAKNWINKNKLDNRTKTNNKILYFILVKQDKQTYWTEIGVIVSKIPV